MMNAALRTFLHDLHANENGRRAEARAPGHAVEQGSALPCAHQKNTRAAVPVQAQKLVLCYGTQDEYRRPMCDGPDVRHVHVQVKDGSTFDTLWCADCRADATCGKNAMLIVDEQPASKYFARLARAIERLTEPFTESALAPHREALAHDAEAEFAEPEESVQ